MNRSLTFWLFLTGILGLLFSVHFVNFSSSRDSEASTPFNFVFISIDSLNSKHLGCYGYERNTSPNIDRLAEKSFLFTNDISPSPWTLPAHTSMFTGMFPLRHGVHNENQVVSDEIKMLPEFFREQGYRTIFLSEKKGWVQPDFNFDRGFDLVQLSPRRFYKGRFTLAAEKISNLAEQEDPFFLFLYTNDAHYRYAAIPPERNPWLIEKDERYRNDRIPIRKYNEDGEVIKKGIGCEQIIPGLDNNLGNYEAQYDAGISFVDKTLGKLFDRLEDEGLMDETIIVLTADHGEEMYRPEVGVYFQHARPWQAIVKVPLIVYIPDSHPRVIDEIVQTVDLLPTVLELAGIETPEGIDGKSLVPLMTEGIPVRDFVYVSRGASWAALQDENWKLVKRGKVFTNGQIAGIRTRMHWHTRKDYLFNLSEDPLEKRNLYSSDDPEAAAMKEFLISELNELESSITEKTFNAEEVELDEKTLESLKALGYL